MIVISLSQSPVLKSNPLLQIVEPARRLQVENATRIRDAIDQSRKIGTSRQIEKKLKRQTLSPFQVVTRLRFQQVW